MNDVRPKRLRGRWTGPILVGSLVLIAVLLLIGFYIYPHWQRSYGKELHFDRAMFSKPIEQPIAFSHRLHVTDKHIDCYYCHSYPERSLNSGLPSIQKCLGCHNYIIPHHEEIEKLKNFEKQGEKIPWKRVYYNPDHVFFPHYRHINSDIACEQCHGKVEQVDRLHKVTFYMGFCIDCHKEKKAALDCAACHQ